MSAHQNEQKQVTSGRRTFVNILGFMLGIIALLLVLKYLMGM